MSEWGRESEDLFRSAREALAPTADDRHRVRASLAAKMGASAIAAGVAATTTKAAASTAAGTTAAKAITISLAAKIALPIVIAAGGAAVALPRVISPAKPVPVAVVISPPPRTPEPKVAEGAPPPSLPIPLAYEFPTTPPPAPLAIPKQAPPLQVASTESSTEEMALVAAIDAALRSGDTARALRLAAVHEQRFPRGLLVEEREGARVIARCASGSHSGADGFLAAHPRSPMRARIVSACSQPDDP